MLWVMRRPGIKRMRRRFAALHPPPWDERIWRSVKAQDRLARKYGLRVLSALFTLLLASIALTVTLMIALKLFEVGAFSVPERR